MVEEQSGRLPGTAKPVRFSAALVVTAATCACAVYANLSFAVVNPAHYRYFPPFIANVNDNQNTHLGGEYFNVGKALVEGKGCSDPFELPTGPTAWMPPVLPTLLAGFLWVCNGNRDAVMAIILVLQVSVLCATGLIVLALVRETTGRVETWVAAIVFIAWLLSDFRTWFQFTHDCWLILLALDLLIAGLCWLRPLQGWTRAISWGLFGGLAALTSPVVGLAWGLMTALDGWRQRTWLRLAVAVLVAGLTLLPWTVRNYLVFGRWIPVKSNLAYEMYQSQCIQPDGVLRLSAFAIHPYISYVERQTYKRLGEIAYIDGKRDLFWNAVRHDPGDFVKRVANRFLAATLWYEPFSPASDARRPLVLLVSRLIHPLPFLAALVLLLTAVKQRLVWAQWVVIGIYLLYLLPYIGVSYYPRYAVPLLGVQVLLIFWAGERILSGPADRVVQRLTTHRREQSIVKATKNNPRLRRRSKKRNKKRT